MAISLLPRAHNEVETRYSAKMALAVENILKPLLSSGGPYDEKVKVIFRPQVQPWHVSSTLTHESALAVRAVWHFLL